MKTLITTVLLLLCTNSFSQTNAAGEKLAEEIYRKISLNKQGTRTFEYVYKNKSPYGKNAHVKYDDFYKTYTISFVKENGSSTSCVIKKSNFIGEWDFKYNGAVYRLSNY